MTTARFDHTATMLSYGKVLVAGGDTGGGYTNSAELYDPATGTWSAAASMATGRHGHTATSLSNGKVLVAGGDAGGWYTNSAELYDSCTKRWAAPVDGLWADAANWMPPGVPSASDDVCITVEGNSPSR